MQQLFQLKNYNVIFEPITMMIDEFKAIADKNKDDNLTLKEMSYVWFFSDIRSDFQNVLDDNERSLEIIHSISLPDNWKPSKEVLNAIDFYKEHARTPSSGLYEASMVAAQFIESKLKNPKAILEEVDSRDNPLYKLTDVTRLLKDVPEIMKKLHDARKQVITEIEAESQLKGGKSKSMFENGI